MSNPSPNSPLTADTPPPASLHPHLRPVRVVGAGFLFYDPRPALPPRWQRLAKAGLLSAAESIATAGFRSAVVWIALEGWYVVVCLRGAGL